MGTLSVDASQCTLWLIGFPSAASRPNFAETLAEQTATRTTDIKLEREGIREPTVFRREETSNFPFADDPLGPKRGTSAVWAFAAS